MARLSLITVYLASIFAIHFVIVSSETWGDISEKLETINISINVNASSPKNMTKTVAENKNLTKLVEEGQIFTKLVESKPQHLLQPRAVTTGSVAATTTITYRLGNRVSGDRVIASTSAGQQWAVAQNITQNLVYPRAGVGAIITYVEIIVDQSSNLGRGYVTIGGIGQRQIAITIEAQKTLLFRQNTQIYGY